VRAPGPKDVRGGVIPTGIDDDRIGCVDRKIVQYRDCSAVGLFVTIENVRLSASSRGAGNRDRCRRRLARFKTVEHVARWPLAADSSSGIVEGQPNRAGATAGDMSVVELH